MPNKEPNPIKSRGRPVLSKSEILDTRAHISACALRLFQESGYGSVSIRRLAKEAGCTAMTIYRYFDRKIDILRGLWNSVFDQLFDQLAVRGALASNPIDRINSIALAYVDFWLEHREHYFLVFMSSGITETDVSIFVEDEQTLGRFDILRSLMEDALGSECKQEEVELKSQLLLCLLNGITQNLITISAYPWGKPETLCRAAVASILE